MERANFKTLLKGLKCLLFDVDGVLTDNRVFLLESGELARSMSMRDGFAIKQAAKEGFTIGVISGGGYKPIRKRLSSLGVQEVHLKVDDKKRSYDELLERNGLDAQEVLYMGDDIPDIDIMKEVGSAACPYDAVHEIRAICDFVSDKKGGEGCVRDAIEQTMRAQGLWQEHGS